MTKLTAAVKNLISSVDWRLFIFLLLVLDVKMAVKIIAVILIYILQPNLKFNFKWKTPSASRLPLFYLLAPALAVLTWLIRGSFLHLNENFLFLMGLAYWGLCILIIHQIKLFVEKNNAEKVHHTLQLFFLVNILVSAVNLIIIIFKTGALNPYQFQGMNQQYFISTGDMIRGVSFDFSLTNALINAIGVVYFLRKNQIAMTIGCMCILLLAGSNYTNALIILILVLLFIFKSNKVQKAVIAACLLLLVFFVKVVSPENKQYASETFEKITGQKSFEIKPLSTENGNLAPTRQQDSFNKKASALLKADTLRITPRELKLPGKLISYKETVHFFKTHPQKILLGNGMGHFSSKLAFRATGLDIGGGYPAKLVYIDPDFKDNHMALYLFYFLHGAQHHSIIHTPHSIYNQMAGEYGLAGIIILFVFYFGFFTKYYKKLTYGLPLLLIIGLSFSTDYWFEQLSIVVLFELLVFLDIKENIPEAETHS